MFILRLGVGQGCDLSPSSSSHIVISSGSMAAPPALPTTSTLPPRAPLYHGAPYRHCTLIGLNPNLNFGTPSPPPTLIRLRLLLRRPLPYSWIWLPNKRGVRPGRRWHGRVSALRNHHLAWCLLSPPGHTLHSMTTWAIRNLANIKLTSALWFQ
jgi:hypothetical protein